MDTLFNKSMKGIKGHLEVIKIYNDGTEEVHFSEDNVITSGMGYTLLKAFSTSGAGSITDFQIVYFQLGTSGSLALQVFENGDLGNALADVDYGDSASFEIDSHDYIASGVTSNGDFGVIPFPYIKKVSPTRVMYQIHVGADTANNLTINEVGLWSRNPDVEVIETSYLCAYRFFTALQKTDSFSILFKWTIEF
jgi:hypothetical protein